MNIKQMEYIIAIADAKSFSHAAKELYISQPALSTHVSKLEDELGIRIFERTTSSLELTYAGKIFIDGIREMMIVKERMDKEIRDVSTGSMGKIKVGLTVDMVPYFMPFLLKEYQMKFENVIIEAKELLSNEMETAVTERDVEFGMIPFFKEVHKKNEKIKIEEVCREEIVIVGNKDFITENHMVNGLDDRVDASKINEIPLIMLPEGSYYRKIVEQLCDDYDIEPTICQEAADNLLAYRLATLGFGAAIVPKMVTELVKSIEDTPIYSITPSKYYWKLEMLYHKNLYMGVIEKEFLSTFRKVANQLIK